MGRPYRQDLIVACSQGVSDSCAIHAVKAVRHVREDGTPHSHTSQHKSVCKSAHPLAMAVHYYQPFTTIASLSENSGRVCNKCVRLVQALQSGG